MDQRVLFGLNSIREIEIPGPDGLDLPGQYRVVTRDAESDVYYEQRDDIAFRYIVHSGSGIPSRYGRNRSPRIGPSSSLWMHDYGRYLQLPDDLSPRIRALAQKIAEAVTVRDAVQSIESHLKANYGYTLDLKREPNLSPLEDFYSNRRGGIAVLCVSHGDYAAFSRHRCTTRQRISWRKVEYLWGISEHPGRRSFMGRGSITAAGLRRPEMFVAKLLGNGRADSIRRGR